MSSLTLVLLSAIVFGITFAKRDNRLQTFLQENIPDIAEDNNIPFSERVRSLLNMDVDSIEYLNGNVDNIRELLMQQPNSNMKRAGKNRSSVCDCRSTNELVDLGYENYPRYLATAVCQNETSPYPKCWHGTFCKPVEYKVRVLTPRDSAEDLGNDHLASYLPESLRRSWKLRTVVIAAGCFCAHKPPRN